MYPTPRVAASSMTCPPAEPAGSISITLNGSPSTGSSTRRNATVTSAHWLSARARLSTLRVGPAEESRLWPATT
jgi:hypothetical protein